MEILNKITMKAVMGGVEVKTLLAGKEQIDLAQILGFAVEEVKGDKPTQYGDVIWLAGEFKAKNLLNGNQFYAPKLFAPEVMHNIIAGQLKASDGQPKVIFAFVVGIKVSKIAIGYEYCVRSLIEPKEENNPFALIENQMKDMDKHMEHTGHGQTTPQV